MLLCGDVLGVLIVRRWIDVTYFLLFVVAFCDLLCCVVFELLNFPCVLCWADVIFWIIFFCCRELFFWINAMC